MGERSATQWPLRGGVLVAVASAALLVQRAAIAGNRLSSGAWGAVVARFDLAVPADHRARCIRRGQTEPRWPQQREVRNRVAPRDLHRVGTDHPVRQGSVARAGLARSLSRHAGVLPHPRHSPSGPWRRTLAADPVAHDRGDAASRWAHARRCRAGTPLADPAVPRCRCSVVPSGLHGRGPHRSVRSTELAAQPPRSRRPRTCSGADRQGGHRCRRTHGACDSVGSWSP